MIIFLGWTTKKGKVVRICIAWGKDKGACNPKLTEQPTILDGNSEDDISVLVRNRKFSSNEMSILSDESGRYGRVSDRATELAFQDGCSENEITKLSDIQIENKKTNERISMSSFISLLKTKVIEENEDDKNSSCSCSGMR